MDEFRDNKESSIFDSYLLVIRRQDDELATALSAWKPLIFKWVSKLRVARGVDVDDSVNELIYHVLKQRGKYDEGRGQTLKSFVYTLLKHRYCQLMVRKISIRQGWNCSTGQTLRQAIKDKNVKFLPRFTSLDVTKDEDSSPIQLADNVMLPDQKVMLSDWTNKFMVSLPKNERKVLKVFVKDPLTTQEEAARKVGLTGQGVWFILQRLQKKWKSFDQLPIIGDGVSVPAVNHCKFEGKLVEYRKDRMKGSTIDRVQGLLDEWRSLEQRILVIKQEIFSCVNELPDTVAKELPKKTEDTEQDSNRIQQKSRHIDGNRPGLLILRALADGQEHGLNSISAIVHDGDTSKTVSLLGYLKSKGLIKHCGISGHGAWAITEDGKRKLSEK